MRDELWSIDYDSQENRLLAHFSEDPALLKIISEGLDIHHYNAAEIYQVPYGTATPEQRDIAKRYSYAEAYGAGIKRLSKGLSISQDEVRMMRDRTRAAYPGVQEWKKRVESDAKRRFADGDGPWGLTWLGRKVYADEYEGFEPKFYTLSNYILQGSGADVLKVALNRIAAAGLSKYIYLPVHDEILFSLPSGPQGVELANELAILMTFKDEFIVPLTCAPAGPFNAWEPH
jgi:DNA polymerase-1